jgi:hypothetical protein
MKNNNKTIDDEMIIIIIKTSHIMKNIKRTKR